jgi:hypothetical protein
MANISSAIALRDPETQEIVNIDAVIDGMPYLVPAEPKNTHYAEIIRQVGAGILVIQEFEQSQP